MTRYRGDVDPNARLKAPDAVFKEVVASLVLLLKDVATVECMDEFQHITLKTSERTVSVSPVWHTSVWSVLAPSLTPSEGCTYIGPVNSCEDSNDILSWIKESLQELNVLPKPPKPGPLTEHISLLKRLLAYRVTETSLENSFTLGGNEMLERVIAYLERSNHS